MNKGIGVAGDTMHPVPRRPVRGARSPVNTYSKWTVSAVAGWLLLHLLVVALSPARLEASVGADLSWLREALERVVTVRVIDRYGDVVASGSGFFVEQGTVITNAHVLKGSSQLELVDSSGVVLSKVATFLGADPDVDLALLQVDGPVRLPMQMAETDTAPGDYVIALGSPLGLGSSISEGISSGLRDLQTSRLLQITAPISPGSSGGPVLNRRGQVVGVSTMSISGGQNVNFAVPQSILRSFLAKPREPRLLEYFRFNVLGDPDFPPEQALLGAKVAQLRLGELADLYLRFDDGDGHLLPIVGLPFEEASVTVNGASPFYLYDVLVTLQGKERVIRRELLGDRVDFVLPGDGVAFLWLPMPSAASSKMESVRLSVQKPPAKLDRGNSSYILRHSERRSPDDMSVLSEMIVVDDERLSPKTLYDGPRVLSIQFEVLESRTTASGEDAGSRLRIHEEEVDCVAWTWKPKSADVGMEWDGSLHEPTAAEVAMLGFASHRPFDSSDDVAVLQAHYVCGMWGPK